jgi:hypothetical protein
MNRNKKLGIKNKRFLTIGLKYVPKLVLSGLVAKTVLGWADHPGTDGTGHLSTKITCNVEKMSTLCGAPKLLIMVGSLFLEVYFSEYFPVVLTFCLLITDVYFIFSG